MSALNHDSDRNLDGQARVIKSLAFPIERSDNTSTKPWQDLGGGCLLIQVYQRMAELTSQLVITFDGSTTIFLWNQDTSILLQSCSRRLVMRMALHTRCRREVVMIQIYPSRMLPHAACLSRVFSNPQCVRDVGDK